MNLLKRVIIVKIFQILLLIVLIVPFVEIYLLLGVGSVIGAFPTVLLVVFTAVLGSWLLRQQGFETFRRFQNCLARGEVPAYELIEGALILVGGALLLTPGFVTDAIGFACLVPSTRKKLAQYIIEHHVIQNAGFAQPKANNNVLDGEFHREE